MEYLLYSEKIKHYIESISNELFSQNSLITSTFRSYYTTLYLMGLLVFESLRVCVCVSVYVFVRVHPCMYCM